MSATYLEPTEDGVLFDQNVSNLLGAYRRIESLSDVSNLPRTYRSATCLELTEDGVLIYQMSVTF